MEAASACFIWLTHGGELIRAAPEQLRYASSLEKFCHESQYPGAVSKEYRDIRKDLKRGQWTDISGEVPSEEDFEDTPNRGQFERPEAPDWKRRDRGSADEPAARVESKRSRESPKDAKRSSSLPAPTRRMRQNGQPGHNADDVGDDMFIGWTERIDDGQILQAELVINDSQVKRFTRDPVAWIANALRKGRKELSMRDLERMPEADREAFDEAKATEISEFLREGAVSGVSDATGIPRERLLGMRWLLNWKISSDGTKKAKARIIIQVYQDSDLLELPKQSPTCS